MRSKSAIYFICSIRYDKIKDDGMQERVTESYIVDAHSFTEAEERIIKEMTSYISGEFDVKACAVAPFSEVLIDDNNTSDKWYKARLDFIGIDEKGKKEKHTKVCYLVNANSIEGALKNVHSIMGGAMIDYNIISLQEMKYCDVFEYEECRNNNINNI